MSFYDPKYSYNSNNGLNQGYNIYNPKKSNLNRFISYHNDRLHLGWVFLRNKVFKELPTDIHQYCYLFVNESQLIINLQNFEQNNESVSDFFYALVTSSMPMVELDSIIYQNKMYSALEYYQSSSTKIYPKDPESVEYNLLCAPNRFNWGGVSMKYHNRINKVNDDIVAMFKIIDKFLKSQHAKNSKNKNNILNPNENNKRLLQNILVNVGKNYSLIILRNVDENSNDVKYNTESDVALYEYSSIVWKDRVNLYDLLIGIIKIKSCKWKCNDKTEIINHVLQLINHSSKQITLYIDIKTSDFPRRLS